MEDILKTINNLKALKEKLIEQLKQNGYEVVQIDNYEDAEFWWLHPELLSEFSTVEDYKKRQWIRDLPEGRSFPA